jgi:hypothetical protein
MTSEIDELCPSQIGQPPCQREGSAEPSTEFESEVRVTGRTGHAEHRVRWCHFGGAVFGGIDMAWLGGSSAIHTWVHLSQR